MHQHLGKSMIEELVEKNKQFRYATEEEFLKDAIHFRINAQTGESKAYHNLSP